MRYPHVVETFPNFYLGAVPSLIRALEINDEDYVASWNHTQKHWETHALTTSVEVKEGQRLIYKLIRRITRSFPDEKCPGLADEQLRQVDGPGKRRRGQGDLVIAITPSPQFSTISLGSTPSASRSASRSMSVPPAASISPISRHSLSPPPAKRPKKWHEKRQKNLQKKDKKKDKKNHKKKIFIV